MALLFFEDNVSCLEHLLYINYFSLQEAFFDWAPIIISWSIRCIMYVWVSSFKGNVQSRAHRAWGIDVDNLTMPEHVDEWPFKVLPVSWLSSLKHHNVKIDTEWCTNSYHICDDVGDRLFKRGIMANLTIGLI